MVKVVDHFAQGRLLCTVLVYLIHVCFQLVKECVRQALMHQHVVASDAELATVQESHGCCFLGCVVHVTRLIDDERAFASQLQNAWDQILGRGRSYQLSFLCTSRENNQVNW